MNSRLLVVVAAVLALPSAGQLVISTFAGGGPNNVAGPNTTVGLVTGVAVDSAGNRYFSSAALNRVYRITSTNQIVVVAGSGLAARSGDGGLAVNASLNTPRGLAVHQGFLYIADSLNHQIRRVDLNSGIITAFAGNATAGLAGDGSAATGAQLNEPWDIAIDGSGNVYIADRLNHRIRRVNGTTGIISTFAGTNVGFSGDGAAASSAQLNSPAGVAIDFLNNLYIADRGNNRIRRVQLTGTSLIFTIVNQNGTAGFGGDGNNAGTAQINAAAGVDIDFTSNLLIADTANHRIRRVEIVSGAVGKIETIAGSAFFGTPTGDGGPATSGRLDQPVAVATDALGRIYIADSLNSRIRLVNADTISTIVGDGNAVPAYGGENGPATDAILNQPYAVAVDSTNNVVYIADTFNHRVRKVNAAGTISLVAGTGQAGSGGDGSAATSAQLNFPTAIFLDSAGNLYIADWGNNKIRRVLPDGRIQTYAGTGVAGYNGEGLHRTNAQFREPYGVTVDGGGNVFVADTGNHCVRRIDAVNETVSTAVGQCTQAGFGGDGQPPTAAAARLNRPRGVAVNSTGTVIYIADSLNHRIRWVSSNVLATFAGTGVAGFAGEGLAARDAQLSNPTGVAVDSQNNFYVADNGNGRIRRVLGGNPNNQIVTIGGSGVRGFGGDGGPATDGLLANPYSIAIDGFGRIFVGDIGNNRVRLLNLPCNYQINPGSMLDLPSSSGGPFNVAVTAASGCPWTAIADAGASWIQITGGTNSFGNGTVTFTVAQNTGVPARSANITIAGIAFQVSQVTGCSYSLNPSSKSAASGGESGTVSLTAMSGCGWTATSNASWITITSGASGPGGFPNAGNGTVGYTVAANPNPSQRSGTITMGGQTFTVTQDPAACSYSINPTSGTAGAGGGSGTVGVTALSGCAWTATSNASWITVTSGSSGSGNGTVGYTVAANPNPSQRSGTITIGGQTFTVTQDPAAAVLSGNRFVPVTPCRIADTRNPNGPFGGPAIAGSTSRDFTIPASACGIPSNAVAYSVNVTVVPRGLLGFLTVWPTGQSMPLASTLNSIDGRVKANAAIVPAGTSGAISVFVTHTTDVILDINGYFVPAATASSLAFYPLTPCRVADTRNPVGALGGPAVPAALERSFPVRASACGVPAAAQAYSLNFTAIPRGVLGHLTAWPTGVPFPAVSTLNAVTGQVTANAAIVPAGANGNISVGATHEVDLVIDVNGYFAPPGAGGLSFHNVNPCRVLDTREPSGGGQQFSGQRTTNVAATSCGAPLAAQAYVLSATVVPPGLMGFLTLWPQGQAQPTVSTLNALDGAVTSNMAIVPTANGSVNSFALNPTHLVLDISGYFAP